MQEFEGMCQLRILRPRSAKQPIQQLKILTIQQSLQCCDGDLIAGRQVSTEEAFKTAVQFQQATPASPAQPPDSGIQIRHDSPIRDIPQISRSRSCFLISTMAFAGFNPLGQTRTQLRMVSQRNRRYGSFKSSRRSPVASSRLSNSQRWACNNMALSLIHISEPTRR